MLIPNFRSENFSLPEIINRRDELTPQVINIGMYLMGFMQSLRDHLKVKTGRDIRLKVTSGYRGPVYNSTLRGASPNSYHIWRIADDGQVICAIDITSPDLSLEELFRLVDEFNYGETYLHKGFRFVHVSPYGKDESWEQ